MNLFYPLVLITLVLQGCNSAGHGQVSALPAQPALQTLPANETMGQCRGIGWASPQPKRVRLTAMLAHIFTAGHIPETPGTSH